MKITIKIPFLREVSPDVVCVQRESGKWWLSRADKQTRGDLGWMFTDYDDNSTKRLVQNIFLAWGRMNNPTELPPIDMNYIFTGQHPQSYPPYLKRLKIKCSVFIFYLIFI